MRWFATLLLSVLFAGGARATTYTLEDITYNSAAQSAGVGIPLPPISLTIAPGAVAQGSFDFHARTGPLEVSGDVSQMIAFRVGDITIGADGSGGLYSHLNVDLTFGAGGAITSALFDWLGPESEFYMTGSASSFGGFFSPSDSSLCGYNSSPAYDCQLTAQLVDPPDPQSSPIPEPAAGLIGLSGLALYWLRHRAR